MAAKDIAVKKYVVRLGAEEREQLQALIGKGKSPAKRLLKARILLKADISAAGEGWSDSRIIEALDTSAVSRLVYRMWCRDGRDGVHGRILDSNLRTSRHQGFCGFRRQRTRCQTRAWTQDRRQ